MDEIDLKLFEIISGDPRCSYKDMADKLGISTPAVHRRIQAAREQKILYGPMAVLCPDYARAVGVVIWGESEASFKDIVNKLEGDDCTQILTMMGGNILLVRSFLKNLKDLDKYVRRIRESANMSEPVIGISPIGISGPVNYSDVKLTKVDFKIMSALYKDGRMSVSDISDMINVSPKTVRIHIKKILDENIITLVTIINHSQSGNFATFQVLDLEKGADKKKVMAELKNKFSHSLIETYGFSNQLDMVVTYISVESMGQLREMLNEMEAMDGVNNVVSNVFIQSCGNSTWLRSIISDPEECMEFMQNKKII